MPVAGAMIDYSNKVALGAAAILVSIVISNVFIGAHRGAANGSG